jgi:hypothetical protein
MKYVDKIIHVKKKPLIQEKRKDPFSLAGGFF